MKVQFVSTIVPSNINVRWVALPECKVRRSWKSWKLTLLMDDGSHTMKSNTRASKERGKLKGNE
jgi:hypothetical protein